MERRIKIKVCGMRDVGNIAEVASLGPDYIGFIHYTGSKRYTGEGFPGQSLSTGSAKRVSVFVDESTDAIRKRLKAVNADTVQLHGNESFRQCEELRSDGITVIKAFPVDDDFDFGILEPYESRVDFFLFDTRGKFHGGNGKVFNWDILKKYDQRIPFLLSGGLNESNLGEVEALKAMNIHAVDLNSGVESAPGMKDIEKVKATFGIMDHLNKSL